MAGHSGEGARGAGKLCCRIIRTAGFIVCLGILPAVNLAWSASAGAGQAVVLAQAGTGEEHRFSIPAQDLGTALTAYADAAGLRVLFVSSDFAGLRGQAVNGSYTVEEALRLLLLGTGVSWRFNADGSVTLEKAPANESGAAVMNTVMVSGEKIERSLQDTASSVAVTDSLALEQEAGLSSTDDIMQRTPNIVTSGTDNLAPAIRGIDGTGPAQGADAFFAGTRPRLNVQIDGRPASYNEVAFGDVSLWDVDQVEIYRGAQSTLQGRNAIGGALIVKTKDPSYTPEYSARLITGNNKYRQRSLMASGPLVDDQLAVRFTYDRLSRESFVGGFQSFEGTSDPGDYLMQTMRAKLLYEPKSMPELSNLLTVTDARFSGPQTESIARPYREHESSFPPMPVFEPSSTSGVLATTWELNDTLTLENTASFTKVLIERLSPATDGIAKINGHEAVVEPRLRFSAVNDRLTGMAGIYLFKSRQNETIDLFGGGKFDDDVKTAAIFADMTYALTDSLSLIAGSRFERERHTREGIVESATYNIPGVGPVTFGPFIIDLDETYQVFLPKLGLSYEVDEQWTVGAVVSKGYNGGGAGFTYDSPFVSYTFDPEYVWTAETFARGSLLGGRLSLNGNLFYSKYTDFQLPFDLNDNPDIWSFIIDNADNVVTYGLELSAAYQASPSWQFSAGLGLLNTEIKRYSNQPLESNELPRSPDITTNLGLKYLSDGGWEFSTDARYLTEYFSSVKNLQEEETDDAFVVNTQLAYVHEHGRFFAFVKNIFGESEPIMIEPGNTAVVSDDAATITHPRTFGIGAEITF